MTYGSTGALALRIVFFTLHTWFSNFAVAASSLSVLDATRI